MTVERTAEGKKLTLKVAGRLDTITYPKLEKEIEMLDHFDELVLDLADLEYISSAGLRVLLHAHKCMKGAMTVVNPGEMVMEIFRVTGFDEVLNIAE